MSMDAAPVTTTDNPKGPIPVRFYLGRLARETDERILRTHFSRFGEVTEARVMRNSEGKSRNFGFLTFANRSAASRAIRQKKHEIQGRNITIEEANPPTRPGKALTPVEDAAPASFEVAAPAPTEAAGQMPVKVKAPAPAEVKSRATVHTATPITVKAAAPAAVEASVEPGQPSIHSTPSTSSSSTNEADPITLYLGRMAEETNERILRTHFSHFGEVTEVRVIREHDGVSRTYGFLKFANRKSGTRAIRQRKHVVQGRRIVVEEARTLPRRPGKSPASVAVASPVSVQVEAPTPVGETAPVSAAFGAPAPSAAAARSAVSNTAPSTTLEAAILDESEVEVESSASVLPEHPARGIPMTIYIEGLAEQTRGSTLAAYFGRFGLVKNVVLNIDPSGYSKHYGFVTLHSRSAARNAVSHKEHVIEGRSVTVRNAKFNYGTGHKERKVPRTGQEQEDFVDMEVVPGGSSDPGSCPAVDRTLDVLRAADIIVLWSAPLGAVREALGRSPM